MTRPAAILCKGESLQRVTPEMLAGHTVIAVNSAIERFPGLVHYLAIQDPIGSFPLPPHNATVLTSMAQVAAHPTGRLSLEMEETTLAMLERDLFPPRLYTFPAVLMWALRRAFDPIAVYGADMKGAGSVTTPWDPAREEDAAWTARWVAERELVGQVIEGWGGGRVRMMDAETPCL